MELRCVIAVIRHGDRTPKQKMKMEVKHTRFFALFEKYEGYKTGKLKLKKPEQLQEVLDITRVLVLEQGAPEDSEAEEQKSKLEQLKTVLEMYGHFSGINRKVQLTYLPYGRPKASSEDEDARKVASPSLLLVLKWGGELTPAGRVQAEELGRAFRCMYPGGQGDYAGFPGCGLLRLHSTYRHDLKIYASDEGRVQMTAAAFAKGLLALEGELTPILVQMVKSANMNGLLDSDSDSLSSCQHRVKARLREIMQKDAEFCQEDQEKLAPTGSTSLIKSMGIIKNPVEVCDQVFALIENLTCQIQKHLEDPKFADLQLYHSETLELMLQRWRKLEQDFRLKNRRYDISKIPDIYDCIKYDVQHNTSLQLEGTAELFKLSKALADVVIPQEYGISKQEKLEIAVGFCLPLIRKIQLDLQRTHEDESVNKLHPLYSRGVLSPGRHVRTRLYFTSESHVHSLLSIFRYGGLLDESRDPQWKRAMDHLGAISELNYMTQIVIMLYEDNNKDPSSEERFHVELHFSPGVKGCEKDGNAPAGFGFRPASAEKEANKPEQGSLEDLTGPKGRGEADPGQQQPAPQPTEPVHLQRRSPLIRNRKTGSMEVLSESSSKVGGYRLFSYSRHSSEVKQSGLGSQCTGLFSTTVLGGSSSAPNLQDYARSHGKKFASGFLYKDGRCILFRRPLSCAVEGSSGTWEKLQRPEGVGHVQGKHRLQVDLMSRQDMCCTFPCTSRTRQDTSRSRVGTGPFALPNDHLTPGATGHRSLCQCQQSSDEEVHELLSMPAVKRFSVSFAKHPTNDELEGGCLAQLLRRFCSDFAISLDAPLARHLHQCFYHLRLFRNWLVSGQGDLESLHGAAGDAQESSFATLHFAWPCLFELRFIAWAARWLAAHSGGGRSSLLGGSRAGERLALS
uniref:Inositol hexakisphosphate and diphosphoinositol-pentakisphosphate kinase 1 n=1 Tax=Sphaerodactylus townsendi TaxID=933632 RepID=A0ACB8E504_9SAUR